MSRVRKKRDHIHLLGNQGGMPSMSVTEWLPLDQSDGFPPGQSICRDFLEEGVGVPRSRLRRCSCIFWHWPEKPSPKALFWKLYGKNILERERMRITWAGFPLTCLRWGVRLWRGRTTSDLLCVTDKVAPCGYLFNLVDAHLEQELGGLPAAPKE